MQIETEVRYRLEDLGRVRSVLDTYEQVDELEQTDHYLDPPDQDFAGDMTRYLRVRVGGGNGSFDLHLVRGPDQTEEYETGIEDPDELLEILEQLGFSRTVTVEKERTVYEIDGFAVTLDHIRDLGTFVEIETTSEDPDREQMTAIADELELTPDQQVTGKGYPDMVREQSDGPSYREGVVGVLHTTEGYVLVHKPGRDEDEWLFPGGGMEDEDDSVLAAFYREMDEELDLDPDDITDVTDTGISHEYEWGEKHRQRTGHDGQRKTVIVARLPEGTSISLSDQDELDGLRTVPAEDVPDTVPYADMRSMWEELASRELLPHQ